MAITINSSPFDLQGSKNPLEFKVTTDKYEIQAATLPVYIWEFSDGLYAGTTIQLNLLGVEYLFEIVNTVPDDTGLQIPEIGAETLEEYLVIFSNAINDHFEFGEYYYTLKTSPTTIQLNGKYQGSKYGIDFIDESSGTVFETLNVPGQDALYNQNFAIAYHLFLTGKGETLYPILVDSGSKIPDINGELYFDFSSALNDYLEGIYPRPDLSLLQQINSESIQEFYVVFAEQYGSPVAKKKRYQSLTRYVIHGGLSFIDFPTKKDLLTSFNLKFLTPFQGRKSVTQEQDVFLNFAHKSIIDQTLPEEDIHPIFFVYYTDGTSDNIVGATMNIDAPWKIAVYNCGFLANALDALQPSKTPYKYIVRIVGEGGYLTDPYNFYLIEAGFSDKLFHYKNSLGVYETILFHGVQSYGIELSYKEIQKTIPDNYSSLFFDVDHTEHEVTHQYTLSSGQFKTKAELEASLDALLSSDIFYYDDQNRQVKILIKKGKVKLYDDHSGLWAYSFNYSLALTDKNFS